jgi:hypothetical protein
VTGPSGADGDTIGAMLMIVGGAGMLALILFSASRSATTRDGEPESRPVEEADDRLQDLDSDELIDYRVVGAGEADPTAGCISYTSPVGSALLGRLGGDVFEVNVPRGLCRFEVLEIGL